MSNKVLNVAQSVFYLSLSALVIGVLVLIILNPKINNLIQKKQKGQPEITLNHDWNYDYESEIDAEKDYPLVHLRDGFKVIKQAGNKVLVGWKYEVLNVSEDDLFVTINYKATDHDGFIVGEGSGSEWVKGGKSREILNTFQVSIADAHRLANSTWSIELSPDYKKKGINRFEKAAEILKDNAPFWVRGYLSYRFVAKRSVFADMPDKETFDDKWVIIAEAMEVKPDPELPSLRKKVGLEEIWNLPPWEKTSKRPEYQKLTEEQKSKINEWLCLQEEYGGEKGIAPTRFIFER